MDVSVVGRPRNRDRLQTELAGAANEGFERGLGTSDDVTDHEDLPTFRRPRPSTLRHRVMIADVLAIALGFAAASLWQAQVRPIPETIIRGHILLAASSMPVWLAALGMNKMFTSRAVEQPAEELRRLLASCMVGVGAIVAIAFVFQYAFLSRLWVASLFPFVFGALALERQCTRRVFARLRRKGRIARRVAIIGTDDHAVEVMRNVHKNPGLGYEVIGFIGNDNPTIGHDVPVLGGYERAADVLRAHDCVGAMISLSSVDHTVVNRLTRQLTDDGFHVSLLASLRDIDLSRMRPQCMDGQAMVYVEPIIRGGWRASAKRIFDVVVAVTALLITAPLLAIAAVAIKLESAGPVLFRQQRVGLEGRRFEILKLRTMTLDAESRLAELQHMNEADGPLFKMRNDPRVTRVGRVLRKLSIDEFPQFWNVLRGDMSVVGPRPALPDEVAQWDLELRDRLRVLPGITGMWQVSGRSDSNFDAYKRLDLYYVDNWSLVHDVQIVVKTFAAVVMQRGAH
jgi:exopolysaccharide biosynthesis polyprenyl glycosylphosphotransferase